MIGLAGPGVLAGVVRRRGFRGWVGVVRRRGFRVGGCRWSAWISGWVGVVGLRDSRDAARPWGWAREKSQTARGIERRGPPAASRDADRPPVPHLQVPVFVARRLPTSWPPTGRPPTGRLPTGRHAWPPARPPQRTPTYATPRATQSRCSNSIALSGCSGRASSAPGRQAEIGDRRLTRLEREPAEPADGGSFVAVGVAAAEDQADPQGVVERDLGQLARRGGNERLVAGLERPAKSRIGIAVARHRTYVRIRPGRISPRQSYTAQADPRKPTRATQIPGCARRSRPE